jgi:hypothetical protein
MRFRAQRYSQLSPSRQALIRWCQAINHGSVEDLRIEGGQPVLDGSSTLVRDIKLDADDGPRPEVALVDFVLSNEVLRLMRQLDATQNGTVRRIEVRGGIPRRISLATRFSLSTRFSDATGQRVK